MKHPAAPSHPRTHHSTGRRPSRSFLARLFSFSLLAASLSLNASTATAQVGPTDSHGDNGGPLSSVASSAEATANRGDAPAANALTPGPTTAQGALNIDLALVKRIKVAGVDVAETPIRVGNLDILAPIIGDGSAILSGLGATASQVAVGNVANPNTPTDDQIFQINLPSGPPIVLTVGKATATIDNVEQTLRTAPLVMNGKIWLPVYSLAPLMGAAVRLQPDGTLHLNPTVQSVELFPAKGYTVMTVKLSAPLPNKGALMGSMDDPPKLYFDFRGYSMGFDALNSTDERVVSGGLGEVQQARAGIFQKFPDTTRVVLDLKKEMTGVAQPFPDKTVYAILLVAPGGRTPSPRTLITPTVIPAPSSGSLRGYTIVVDAGHGGHDTGAPGARSYEKNHTLDIARRLRANLQARGATVLMSRDSDNFISLQGRVDFANSHHADIFFSVHIDSFKSTSTGTTTHFWTAQSAALARQVQNELARATGLKSRGIEQSRFFVIRKTTMPSVLTESCFISNPNEEALLVNPKWRQKVADGMAQGIANYFVLYRPHGVLNE